MANSSKRQKVKKAFNALLPNEPDSPAADNDGLMDDLFAVLESRDAGVQKEAAEVIQEVSARENSAIPPDVLSTSKSNGGGGKSSKDRFRERQARKAQALLDAQPQSNEAEEARLAQEAKYEEESLHKTCTELGVEIFEVNPDGHCLFSAVADQLSLLGLLPKSPLPPYAVTRQAAAAYMVTHQDDFLPFIPSIEGEDALDASVDTGILTVEKFQAYCYSVANTALWGGEPEIMALARAYHVKIAVVQAGSTPIVVHSPHPGADEDPYGHAVRISYHRRMYGLGEHYNSLRPKIPVVHTLSSPF